MKTRIVNSKDLDINCWSALRYLDSCEDCDKVDKCKLEEGRRGRLRKAAKKFIAETEKFQTALNKNDAVIFAPDLIIAAKNILEDLTKTRHPDIKKS